MAQAPPQQKYSVLPVVLLALSALLAGAGFGIYAPTIVVHAIELGAPEAIATAMVMALPSILMLIILLPVAIVADKTGRRKEIVSIGLLLGTIFNALLAMARSWIELAVYRTVSGVVFAFTSLYMAMAIFVTPERLRGTALGILGGSMMLGMGVSQLFAGAILGLVGGYSGLYLVAAVLSLIALLLLLPVKVPRVQLPAMKASDIAIAFKARGVYWTAIAICIYLIGWNLLYPSLPLVLSVIYKAPPEIYTLAMGVASLMLGIGTYIWGPVIDKLGGRRTLIMAIIASAIVTYIMYPALGSMWAYAVLFWLVTVFGVVGAPGTSYVASRSVRPELVSIAISAMFIAISVASIVGGFTAGALIASLGLGTTILIAATIELIGGLMMFGLPKV
jgi:MFS family permease